MQFITTDQRIAVENFEIGLIYTVTFTSGSYFLGACIGKGANYVMFQRTAPELIFSLTMEAAADVASIEPLGNDIGKILEYTGSVPVSIKTNGSPLLDYLITGNTTQSGTPTPENPVMPQGCGELETVGAKAGQYKIPILSGGVTTPVYLGEVQSTRQIYKLVLTGDEDWSATAMGVNDYIFRFTPTSLPLTGIAPICTHYIGSTATIWVGLDDYCITTSILQAISIRAKNNYSSVSDFTNYLQQQYAAGTPVCVWYVLTEPTTGIVNEPLMRIGDYADTVSYRQSGVNVPTTDGLNIFDIDTTVKPSEVYLKYFSPLL